MVKPWHRAGSHPSQNNQGSGSSESELISEDMHVDIISEDIVDRKKVGAQRLDTDFCQQNAVRTPTLVSPTEDLLTMCYITARAILPLLFLFIGSWQAKTPKTTYNSKTPIEKQKNIWLNNTNINFQIKNKSINNFKDCKNSSILDIYSSPSL